MVGAGLQPFAAQDVIEAIVRSARPPIAEKRAVLGAIDPEAAGPGSAMARFKVADGRFVQLEMAACKQAGPQQLVKGAQPPDGEGSPVHHRLARDGHAKTLPGR